MIFKEGMLYFISVVGLTLLFLKLVGIVMPIGYFGIAAIILWPITIVAVMLGLWVILLVAAFIHIFISDYRGSPL